MDFLVTILYSQISIYDDPAPDFPKWTEEHVAQGFAWRPGHVSFGVPDHNGQCRVIIKTADKFDELKDKDFRVIRVPIELTSSAWLATVIDEHAIPLETGTYAIEYRLSAGQPNLKENPYMFEINITFKKDENPSFKIVRNGGEMISTEIITTTAEPAI